MSDPQQSKPGDDPSSFSSAAARHRQQIKGEGSSAQPQQPAQQPAQPQPGQGWKPVDLPTETPPASGSEPSDPATQKRAPAALDPYAPVEAEASTEPEKPAEKPGEKPAESAQPDTRDENMAKMRTKMEALEREKQELAERLSVHEIDQMPEFRQSYVEPLQRAESSVKRLLTNYGIEADEASRVLSMNLREVTDWADEHLKSGSQAFVDRFAGMLDAAANYEEGKRGARETQRKLLAERQGSDLERQQQSVQERQQLAERTLQNLSKSYAVFARSNEEGADEWNSTVAKLAEDAQAVITSASDEHRAAFAALGVAAHQRLYPEWLQQREQIGRLQAELNRLKGVSSGPGVGPTSGAAAPAASAGARQRQHPSAAESAARAWG